MYKRIVAILILIVGVLSGITVLAQTAPSCTITHTMYPLNMVYFDVRWSADNRLYTLDLGNGATKSISSLAGRAAFTYTYQLTQTQQRTFNVTLTVERGTTTASCQTTIVFDMPMPTSTPLPAATPTEIPRPTCNLTHTVIRYDKARFFINWADAADVDHVFNFGYDDRVDNKQYDGPSGYEEDSEVYDLATTSQRVFVATFTVTNGPHSVTCSTQVQLFDPPTATPFATTTSMPTSAAVEATFTAQPTIPPTLAALPPCPAGTGPNGIRAGDYNPHRLTHEERRWMWQAWGNQGDPAIGWGGLPCGVDYGSSDQNFFAMVCARGNVGPEGYRPGDYNPQSLPQSVRQFLWDEFRENGGQGGGTAPVGYGGQRCPNGQQLRICPSGTGPGGIVAGSYDPNLLTGEQRLWMWQVWGYQGEPSVGWGGIPCQHLTSPAPDPDTPPEDPTIANNWAIGATVNLCEGTEIRAGSGLGYAVHTVSPSNWPVDVIGGPRQSEGYTWWDISRTDGGTGWVRQDQADCHPIPPIPPPDDPVLPVPPPPEPNPSQPSAEIRWCVDFLKPTYRGWGLDEHGRPNPKFELELEGDLAKIEGPIEDVITYRFNEPFALASNGYHPETHSFWWGMPSLMGGNVRNWLPYTWSIAYRTREECPILDPTVP